MNEPIIEVIQNPTGTIALVVTLLVSVTALTFLAVIFLCGFRPGELLE